MTSSSQKEQILDTINIFLNALENILRDITREELSNFSRSMSSDNSTNSEHENLLSRKKFLEMTGKSPGWLDINMKKGLIPYCRIGRSIFINMSQIQKNTKSKKNISKIFNDGEDNV